MAELGFNYRVSDVHCALGLSQLNRLSECADKRRQLTRAYDKALAPLRPIVKAIERMPGDPVWHLYVVLINFAKGGVDRKTVMKRLQDSGIGSQVHYIPVHRQPYYLKRYGAINLPGANNYYERCLALPLFTSMTETDVNHVAETLGRVIC